MVVVGLVLMMVMMVVVGDDVVVLPTNRVSVPNEVIIFFLEFLCVRGSDWVCLCGPLCCHLLLGVSPLFYPVRAPRKKIPRQQSRALK